jgi:hypothetical protein
MILELKEGEGALSFMATTLFVLSCLLHVVVGAMLDCTSRRSSSYILKMKCGRSAFFSTLLKFFSL